VTASEAKLAYEAAKAAHDAATAALDKIERRGVEPWLDQGLATATTIYQAKRSAAKRKRQATAATLERATFALSAAVAVGRADAARQAAEEAEAEAIEAAQEAESGEERAEARAAAAEAEAAAARSDAQQAIEQAEKALEEAQRMTDEQLEAKAPPAAAPPPGIAAPPPARRQMPKWAPAKEFSLAMHRVAMAQGWPLEIEEEYHQALLEVDDHAELVEVAAIFVVPEPAPAKNTKKLLELAKQMQGAEGRKVDGTNKGPESFYILGSDVLDPEGRMELALKVGAGIAGIIGIRYAAKKWLGM
jgi:hypothetical protein